MSLIDMSNAATAPPRKRQTRATAAKAPEPSVPMGEAMTRARGLMGLGQLGQGLCLLTGQYADAATIGNHWAPVATELANLSVTPGGEWLAKPIDLVIQVGPFGALIAALVPFGMQIAANHGWIDASRVGGHGVVPPEVLDSQMRAQVAAMQAEEMRKQQAALREAKAAEAALNEELAMARAAANGSESQ